MMPNENLENYKELKRLRAGAIKTEVELMTCRNPNRKKFLLNCLREVREAINYLSEWTEESDFIMK